MSDYIDIVVGVPGPSPKGLNNSRKLIVAVKAAMKKEVSCPCRKGGGTSYSSNGEGLDVVPGMDHEGRYVKHSQHHK